MGAKMSEHSLTLLHFRQTRETGADSKLTQSTPALRNSRTRSSVWQSLKQLVDFPHLISCLRPVLADTHKLHFTGHLPRIVQSSGAGLAAQAALSLSREQPAKVHSWSTH